MKSGVYRVPSVHVPGPVPISITIPERGTGPFPVIYDLHGLMRWNQTFDARPTEEAFYEKTWLPLKEPRLCRGVEVTDLQQLCDVLEVVIVRANGGASWYIDSPVLPACRYESHVVEELVPYVDACAPVRSATDQRMLVGHSMGGYGALRLLARHPDLFYGAGLRSASLRMMGPPKEEESIERFGPMLGEGAAYERHWFEVMPKDMLTPVLQGSMPLAISVGLQDSDHIVDKNKALHEALVAQGHPVWYQETNDGHDAMPWMWDLLIWAAGVLVLNT